MSACSHCDFRGTRVLHKAHLSSAWYSSDLALLRSDLQNHFVLARNNFSVSGDPAQVRALIVPHAGHYYSGLCAASAYWTVDPEISKVIVLAPSHQAVFSGVALPDYDEYQTPLGTIPVDRSSIEQLKKTTVFKTVPGAYDHEHAVEVQLPLLQGRLKSFSIVPLIVGEIDDGGYEKVAETLSKIIDTRTLVVVSSDFLHHGPNYRYDLFTENILRSIRRVDSQAVRAIFSLSIPEFDAMLDRTKSTICGRNAIKILLQLITRGSFGSVSCRLASYYTSAQMTAARTGREIDVVKLFGDLPDSDAKNSVSYAGLVFTNQPLGILPAHDQLTSYEKRALLTLARDSITNKLMGNSIPEHLLYPILSDGVRQIAGAFVTLNKHDGSLRGCIGQITTNEPLFKTIASIAQSSAFQDGRFMPLTKDELDDVEIDITVLTPPRKVAGYRDIIVGKHGIILKKQVEDGIRSAVYLPQVSKSFGGDLEKMLSSLSRKAGLRSDDWRSGCEFEVFEGYEFRE